MAFGTFYLQRNPLLHGNVNMSKNAKDKRRNTIQDNPLACMRCSNKVVSVERTGTDSGACALELALDDEIRAPFALPDEEHLTGSRIICIHPVR